MKLFNKKPIINLSEAIAYNILTALQDAQAQNNMLLSEYDNPAIEKLDKDLRRCVRQMLMALAAAQTREEMTRRVH